MFYDLQRSFYMPVLPNGIKAAAVRETELHPVSATGQPISAWLRRGETLIEAIKVINVLEAKLAALEEQLAARPF